MIAKSRTSGSLNAPPLPLCLVWASVSGAMTLSTYAGTPSLELLLLEESVAEYQDLEMSDDFLDDKMSCAERILFLNMGMAIVKGYDARVAEAQKGRCLITGDRS